MKLAFAMPHMLRLKATAQPWESAVTGPDQLRMARQADATGYDMIAVPEHFIIPDAHVDLSGPHYFHGIAAMGAMAAPDRGEGTIARWSLNRTLASPA